MGPVVNLKILAHQSHVGFIYQSRALKGVSGTLAIRMIMRPAAEPFVNQRISVRASRCSLAPVCRS